MGCVPSIIPAKNKKRKKKKEEDMKILRQKEKNTDILESNERTDAEEFPQRVTRVGGFRGQKKKKRGSLQPFERNKVKGDFARKLIFHLRQRGVEGAEFKRGAQKKRRSSLLFLRVDSSSGGHESSG